MKILRTLAATVGATSVANEAGVAVESFGGYTKRASAQAFAWLTTHLLGASVTCFVVLDSDFRPRELLEAAAAELRSAGAIPHVWERKELENYLLVPTAIARICGAEETEVGRILDQVSDELRPKVTTSIAADYVTSGRSMAHDALTAAMSAALNDVANGWDSVETRLAMCPAKDVIRGLNREFQQRGLQPVSAESLAAELRSDEVASEMRNFLLEVERARRGDEETNE